jgi:hypothetical protein
VQFSNDPSAVSDDNAVTRLYDLARSGETGSLEFQRLDHLVLDRLLNTYGGEIHRLRAMAA